MSGSQASREFADKLSISIAQALAHYTAVIQRIADEIWARGH